MMKRRVILALCLALVLTLGAFSAAQAAEPTAKLNVRIDLGDKYFWTYPYITSDGNIRKPVAVQVEWSLGTSSKIFKETVVVPDKADGQLAITTEKGAIVNLQISVVDAKNVVVGSGSLQVRNNGQTEKFLIALPDSTAPIVTREIDRLQ